MLNAFIIDDEPESVEVIRSLITMFSPQVAIRGAFTDPSLALEAVKREKPDVILLDIEMPGMTGFEMLRRMPSIDFEIIFITAHQQYAINAIKLSAIDYLLKPIDPTELELALQKAEKKVQSKMSVEKFEVLVNLLESERKQNHHTQQHKIALPTLETVVFVELSNIVMVEAEKNYCGFCFLDRKDMLISKNIGYYENTLEPFGFMRVHRSGIANLHHVVEFVRQDGWFLKMRNGKLLPIANNKKDEIQKRIENLFR